MADIFDENNNNTNNTDPNYWRSFEELYNNKEILEIKQNEFLKDVTSDFTPEKNLSQISRRKFFALLGASAAFAGIGCADYRDKGQIIPYNNRPEGITIGKPNHYASTCSACKNNCGVLIKTREGRPIKIDGNPEHPINKGKICSKGQANILNLYDPSRLQNPKVKRNNKFVDTTWKEVDAKIVKELNNNPDKEIAIITHTINSPSLIKLLNDFKTKYPSTKIYSYELFNDTIRNSAWGKCYGTDKFPIIKWNEAKIILSLEGDFLGTDGNSVEQSRFYSQIRDVENLKKFSRLYVAEGNLSLTGINADYRFPIRPDNQLEFLYSLINEISKTINVNIPNFPQTIISKYSLDNFATKHNLSKKNLFNLVNDLIKYRGEGIIYAGRTLPENVHIVVNVLNEILLNTKLYENEIQNTTQNLSSISDFENLIQSIEQNKVKVIIHFDTNPVYHFSNDFNYKEKIKNVPLVITFSQEENETCAVSNYILPINHDLESWGDFQVRTNIYSTQQPVIAPLYNTRQKEAILLNWLSDDPNNYNEEIYLNYVKANWQNNIYTKSNMKIPFDRFWLSILQEGVFITNEKNEVNFNFNNTILSELTEFKNDEQKFLISFYESYNLGDGRFANNGWLQEIPHSISKVTWDNYVAISEESARELNIKTNDLIEINIGNKKQILPVLIQPGIANKFIAIELGYGRSNCPIVAEGVGFNANVLLEKNGSTLSIDGKNSSPWISIVSSIKKVNGNYKIVSTQEHQSLDDSLTKYQHLKRHIIQEGTVAKYINNSKFLSEGKEEHLPNMYQNYEYKDVKWGMAIDLNKCTGCTQCIISCNVENNIPIVGKEQVDIGREMMWLRIDRYYSGNSENPNVSVQPMLCQHCDQAPCENVCPVAATTHSPDGLNQMAYNRCVGTRYCSNNCPYKVRRFNFYNFRDHFENAYYLQDSLQLLHNPEVTVRSRGVMEKCTFCIQRIMDARSDAIKENRILKGSDVKTACQEACPTNAIYFGDIKDKESEFYKYRNHELGYYVLEELNVKPNVTYLAKLRNTHSEEV